MHIPLAIIPHHSARKLPIPLVPLDIDAQAAVHPKPQQDLVLDGVARAAAAAAAALDALQLQLLQARAQVRQLARQALRLHLEVGRGLCGAELLRVEARDLGRVLGGRVRAHQLRVLRLQRAQLPRELLERRVRLLPLQVARLL